QFAADFWGELVAALAAFRPAGRLLAFARLDRPLDAHGRGVCQAATGDVYDPRRPVPLPPLGPFVRDELIDWLAPWLRGRARAEDGLYSIDALRRLQDAQLPGPAGERARRLAPYVTLGVLGKALTAGAESVLLIDEIDKADPDFPNDLLRELDRMELEIEELG